MEKYLKNINTKALRLIVILLMIIFPVGAALWTSSVSEGVRPYVLSLNISNTTYNFGNSTHVNISCIQENCTDIVSIFPYWRETSVNESYTENSPSVNFTWIVPTGAKVEVEYAEV